MSLTSPPSRPSCPVPNTHTNVLENGDSNKAQFKLKIFSFINNPIVYLHCRLRVCMEAPGATCKIVGAGGPGLLPTSLWLGLRCPLQPGAWAVRARRPGGQAGPCGPGP